MNKIIKIIKNNIFGIILGIIISGISVYAVENIAMIESKEVSYDNSNSHGTKDNVQESIDELYERSGVKTTKWVDPILHGADPELREGLIPVTIDPDGTVRYANLYTEWYNYSEKRWANAVILVSSPSKEYTTGDVILEQDIESYFVWIPRYKYKVWNTGNYTESILGDSLSNIQNDANGKYTMRKLLGNSIIIDVVFGDKETVKIDGLTTKDGGGSGDNKVNVGDYILHPAFALGETELNGIWVGKFETGYNQDGENGNPITPEGWTTQGAQINSELSNHIIVKPNVYSWRENCLEKIFIATYNYHQDDYHSHMMKNTEWGAVAYLSHSAYGIGGEININNNKNFKTGYSSYNIDQSILPDTGSTGEDGKSTTWNTPNGYLASTTGNITGVYDMSGGAWEYVAAYVEGQVGKSGFDNESDLKSKYKDYVDVYNSTSNLNTYKNRILGDATGEMGPFFTLKDSNNNNLYHNSWYANGSYFVEDSYPWFHRGGGWDDIVLGGPFDFARYTGDPYYYASFRLVLSIS